MRWLLIIVGIGIFLIVLVGVTRLREGFVGADIDASKLPDPKELAGRLRTMLGSVGGAQVEGADLSPILQKMTGLLDKYDNPENLGHVMNVKDKDPGELARMYLNISN